MEYNRVFLFSRRKSESWVNGHYVVGKEQSQILCHWNDRMEEVCLLWGWAGAVHSGDSYPTHFFRVKGQVQGLGMGWFLTWFPLKFTENNHVGEIVIWGL